MSLAPGTRLGPYEIVAPLGAGGMGEVYRAHDSKLKRDVALKVLPDVFARDPDRMLRFQREAELLAALNHPEVQCEDLREESRTGLGRGALSADIAISLVAFRLCVPVRVRQNRRAPRRQLHTTCARRRLKRT
jgi:serine/threonine protein kinase